MECITNMFMVLLGIVLSDDISMTKICNCRILNGNRILLIVTVDAIILFLYFLYFFEN